MFLHKKYIFHVLHFCITCNIYVIYISFLATFFSHLWSIFYENFRIIYGLFTNVTFDVNIEMMLGPSQYNNLVTNYKVAPCSRQQQQPAIDDNNNNNKNNTHL